MITLTRLSGSVFALNSDLIERVDCTPDSVVTMVDGTKYVVRESLTEIVSSVRTYRGQVVAIGARLTDDVDWEAREVAPPEQLPPPVRLTAVATKDER